MTASDTNTWHLRLLDRADLNGGLLRLRTWPVWLGLNEMDRATVMTVAAELGRNIVKYAGHGVLDIVYGAHKSPPAMGRHWVSITATDQGPGMADVGWALTDHHSSGQSLGLGLPGVQRLADEFHIDTQPGAGTRVTARLYLANTPSRPQQPVGHHRA